ncbi:hypothetical protein [Alloyangia pacifica]|uniref:hypothetical protein n=1 Tax=Alloyangia pacifica TaxID=311180 RepID=UPI0020C7B6F6|nr:hypothetical protein [Alloyangia pacifica]
MALSVAEMIGAELATAIGAAHGIGRPRWETMARAIEQTGADKDELARLADDVHTAHRSPWSAARPRPRTSPSQPSRW